MRKKKILIHTNPPWIKTGLAENGRELAKYLVKTGKYEVVYYCSQTNVGDPQLNYTPWKSYGCIPNDPNLVNQINQDGNRARAVSYGSQYIDDVIKAEKPDIYWGSDDIWMEQGYTSKGWWKKLNPVLHITVDSKPILNQAYEQAERTPSYVTWAKFAEKEMKRVSPKCTNVQSIYGCIDAKVFHPISPQDKLNLRKKFGLGEKTVIIGCVFRNQLRKSILQFLTAFAEFKKENPDADVKLHLHTSYSEKGSGWDIPNRMAYLGIKNEDVLCSYICKDCNNWAVASYQGEDKLCPYCKSEKGMITPSIVHGVPHEDMRAIYGMWDGVVNPHTSGGLEYNCVNALLCGIPLAVTNYSSGEDFCALPFVTSLAYETTFEAGTNFEKAATSIKSIRGFIDKIYRMTPAQKMEIGRKGYEWASKTFSTEAVGAKWEALFDSLPDVDWSDFSFEAAQKDPDWKLPENYNEMEENTFITLIYEKILGMNEKPGQDGHENWRKSIAQGNTRDKVVEYFRNVAREENAKNKPIEFSTLLDKNGKKRALFVIKESIGDIFLCQSLFEDFHKKYPNTDLYVGVDSKYFSVLEGNPYVHKVLPYQGFFEHEMACTGTGQKKGEALFDRYFHPAIATQRHLSYLSTDTKLLEAYSKATGLKINRYEGAVKFYPLQHSKYITIQASSGMPGKNYDYFSEVITMLIPLLRANGIALIQLGGKGEQPLPECTHLMDLTSIQQTTYIIKNALAHLTNDSCTSHIAGHNLVRLVTLFGATSIENHSPYFLSDNSVMIESHRRGNKPTFQAQESPKTINFIPPEDVVSAVVKALGGSGVSGLKTINIGNVYSQSLFELVPNIILDPNFYKDATITVRMDYEFNEENLFGTINTGRKVMIVSDRPINVNGLAQFKKSIVGVTYEMTDQFDENYVRQLNRTGVKVRYVTREKDPNKIFDMRMKYFGLCVIEQFVDRTKEDFFKAAAEYRNESIDLESKMDKLVFKTNKYLLSKGQAFLSKAHWLVNQPIANFQENSQKVIDSPDFWQDFDFYYIYASN